MDESRIEKLLELDERGATEAIDTLLSIVNQVERAEEKDRPWWGYILWRWRATERWLWAKCGGYALKRSTQDLLVSMKRFLALDPIEAIRSNRYTFDEQWRLGELALELMRIRRVGFVYGAPVVPMFLTSWVLLSILNWALVGMKIPLVGPSSHVNLFAMGMLLAFLALFCALCFVAYSAWFVLRLVMIFVSLRPALMRGRG